MFNRNLQMKYSDGAYISYVVLSWYESGLIKEHTPRRLIE